MKEPTDTQRIEALAEALNTIIVYEDATRITYKSNTVISGKQTIRSPFKRWKCGVPVEALRRIADGLIKAQRGHL
jgi:hypothetical protein